MIGDTKASGGLSPTRWQGRRLTPAHERHDAVADRATFAMRHGA